MQLVDRNGVFKNWNTLKHDYDLQNNLYFQWMQLISAIPSYGENIIKQNNDINTFTYYITLLICTLFLNEKLFVF